MASNGRDAATGAAASPTNPPKAPRRGSASAGTPTPPVLPSPSSKPANGASAGAGGGAGAGSRESATLADVSLTRMYKDRVERFKDARARSASKLSIDPTSSGATTGPPSPMSSPAEKIAREQEHVSRLPRGGYTVDTPAGTVQVGAPPETIKDHMSMGLTVPTFFVVPQQRFDKRTFVNLAEIEFPTFFNFFVLKKKVCIIALPEAIECLRKSFKEGLLGPATIDTSDEFDITCSSQRQPDLRKELDWFSRDPFNPGKHMTVETLVDFRPLTRPADGGPPQVDLGDGVIIRMTGLPEDSDSLDTEVVYEFLHNGSPLAQVPDTISLPDLTPPKTMYRPFQPPTFGVTFLGTSHGFDPNGQTTGFVIWINGKGVMVDPPPHSSLLLQMMGIPPRLIDTLVLTHCHADHDAGTLQKILEEGQVTIMATNTVIGSFVRKYSALTGISEPMLRALFKFRPVRVGAFMPYRSAHFRFFYALHAIPCTGFEVHLGGESIVYSADTFNDPEGIRKMFEAGVMSEGRRDALINFPWHHSLVLHEAGVPPIHTPVAYLASLPDKVKRRIRLVHVAPNAVPKDSGLQLAREGPQNTLRLSVRLPPLALAVNLLDLISNLRFLQQLSLADSRQLVQLGYVRTFAPGKLITMRHASTRVVSRKSEFFIVASGVVQLEVSGAENEAGAGAGAGASGRGSKSKDVAGCFTTGDYFPRELLDVRPGTDIEAATRDTRLTATAQTEVQCFVFKERAFWDFLNEHGVLTDPDGDAYLASEAAVSLNSSLMSLTSRQRKLLRSSFQVARTFEAGEALWVTGSPCTQAFLLSSGSASVTTAEAAHESRASHRASYGPGCLFAEITGLRDGSSHSTTVRAMTRCTAFPLPREAFLKFVRGNPSFMLATSTDHTVATV